MTRDQYYTAQIWPLPLPVAQNQPVMVGWFDTILAKFTDPSPGTRWIAPPEIQTWNPYLRGDPDELVDFYEGYSAEDAMLRRWTPTVPNCDCLVKRRDTPMWRAAELLSVELPDRDNSEETWLKDARWVDFAERGRSMGMDVPLEDPRIITSADPRWRDLPSSIDNRVLRHQLYHVHRYALDYTSFDGRAWPPDTGGRMKDGTPRPIVWTRPKDSSSSWS